MLPIARTLASLLGLPAATAGGPGQLHTDLQGRLHVTASGGASPVAPATVAFTATNPAVKLSAAATAYAVGFQVQNQGATAIYLGPSGVTGSGATVGYLVAAGTTSPLFPASDASLWYAFSAAPCAGVVVSVG